MYFSAIYILLDIAGRSSARVYNQSTVGNNGSFRSLYMKIPHKRWVIWPELLLTIYRKSRIVDLPQISSLGAFIHALLSHAYLCIS